MYVIFLGAKQVSRTGMYSTAANLLQKFTSTSKSAASLPTHFTLPSKDNIPSVALGEFALPYRKLSLSEAMR